jgi:hypothetical protein
MDLLPMAYFQPLLVFFRAFENLSKNSAGFVKFWFFAATNAALPGLGTPACRP